MRRAGVDQREKSLDHTDASVLQLISQADIERYVGSTPFALSRVKRRMNS